MSDAFFENGFVKLKYAVSDEMLTRLTEAVERLSSIANCERELNNPDYLFLNKDEPQSLFKIRDLFRKDRAFLEAALSLTGLDAVASLASGAICFGAEQIVLKRKMGKVYDWHRDDRFAYSGLAFNVGIYLDDSDGANGCLEVIPSSHLWVDNQVAHPGEINADNAFAIDARRGDIVVHNNKILHRSGVNEGDSIRRVVYFDIRDAVEARQLGLFSDVEIRQRTVEGLRRTLVV